MVGIAKVATALGTGMVSNNSFSEKSSMVSVIPSFFLVLLWFDRYGMQAVPIKGNGRINGMYKLNDILLL